MLYRYFVNVLCALSVATVGTAACTNHAETQPRPVAPAPKVDQADADDVLIKTPSVRNGLIYLPRNMIGRRLLESTEIASTGASPDIAYSKPRIVYFAIYDGQLALFETNSSSPHRDLRSDPLIDTFPIVHSSADVVVFAAPQRLRNISAAMPYDVADAPLIAPLRYAEGTVFDVDHAVLETVAWQGENLCMRHAVTVRIDPKFTPDTPSPDGRVLSTRYVRTTLSPYEPSPTFAPLQVQGGEGRYFQVATVVPNTAEMRYLATHWDMHPVLPPVTFGLARQMPPKAAQAIEEGLHYWNRVAQRQILRIERDVDLDTWGGPRMVPVHWISWDTAPHSHAAIQADPLTGEIIAARMFLTSAFSEAGMRQFKREALLAAQEDPHSAAGKAAEAHFSPSLLDRAASDMLRLLAAHEAGHVLGLRHNFAGTQDSEMPEPADVQAAARAYTRGEPTHQRAAGTVMTYTGARTNLLLGSYINTRPLPYDAAAAALLYAQPQNDASLPHQAFCGDLEIGHVYGCAPFLDGSDELLDSADKARAERFNIAIALLQDMHQAVRRNGGRCDAQVYNYLSLDKLVRNMGMEAEKVFAAFQASDAIAVRQKYGPLGHLDPTLYQGLVQDHIAERSKKLGGPAGWIAHVLDAPPGAAPGPGWLERDLKFHLARASLPQLSAEPEATRLWVEQMALYWSIRVEELALKKIIETLTAYREPASTFAGLLLDAGRPQSYPREHVDAGWEGPLAALATNLILATGGDAQASYREDVRMAATRLMSARIFSTPGFAAEARISIMETLTARIAEADGPDNGRRLQQRRASDAKVLRELCLLD